MKTPEIGKRSLITRLFVALLISSFLTNSAATSAMRARLTLKPLNANVVSIAFPLAVTDKIGKLPQPASVIEDIKQGTNGSFSHNGSNTRYDIDWDTPNDRDEVVTAPAEGIAYIHDDADDFGKHVNLDVGPADPSNPNGPRHFWVMAHNKSFLVKDGQHVEMGQPIAMEACTGSPCDGDHIHFGLHSGDPRQNVIYSTSVDNALISSRDVTAGEGSFSHRRTTQFVVGRSYESDNHYPWHTLTTTDWTFTNDSRFWHLGANGGATTIGFNSPGAWILAVNSDPSIVSPLLDIQAGTFSGLEITMASQATDTLGAVYYATETSPNFSSDKVFTFTVVPGGGYHTISVPFTGSGKDQWHGRITRLRIDPVGNASGQAVGIQRIRLIGDMGGANDEFPPQLAVTSHSNGQSVSTSSITLSGTATDNGRGESGISSVTVNGTRASGDTATGSNTANWSINLPLNSGSNQITVQARDASPDQNLTQQTLTIVRSTGGSSCSSVAISPGQTIGGSLSTSDCFLPGTNKYHDVYAFNGVAGQQIAATMDSSNFDTYLYLTNSANQILAEDNNSGPGTNSRIVGLSGFYTLPANGTYYLRASSAFDNASGSYSVGLSQCVFSISSSGMEIGPGNGGGAFLVDTSSGCNWSAVSDSTSWLTTSSSGPGDGRVEFSFTANPSTNPRTGRITVGGLVHTVTQIGIGGGGSVRFSSATYSANEGSGEVTITVTRQGGTHSGTVNYQTSDGTATAGSDYTSTSGLLLFGENQNSKTFTIPILDDSLFEGNESINLTLFNQGNSFTMGSPSTATLTITDNESSPTPTPTPDGTNFALASNGGIATASSTLDSGRSASAANNGDRKGLHWGTDPATGSGWHDATQNSYPDSLQIDFNGPKTINEINVFTIQDNYNSPVEPTDAMTFATYGITAFEVQYWNGTSWATVPGGTVTGNNKIKRTIAFSSLTTSKIRVLVNSALAGYSRITEVEAWGAPSSNVALASNGGSASASSTLDAGRGASATNNGDRKGMHWGTDPSTGSGWHDATQNSQPDWLQIDFNGPKLVEEINVFTIQDNYNNPVEPTDAMTFGIYGITAFEVQYWTGSAWATVPGGSVSGNNKVKRSFTFSPITTTKVRVLVNAALAGYSRITEIEAWGTDASSTDNVALALNGGVASASSSLDAGRAATGANNGDRKGIHWGTDPATGSGWHDNTQNTYPDWLQIDFSESKTINEIRVFTIQDSYNNPVEPTDSLIFATYGITAFEVQYWTGSAWITVPGGSVTGNNKVKRVFSFSPIATSKIRVLVNAALAGYSRITEVEAYVQSVPIRPF